MNAAAKTLLLLVLLACVGAGVVFLLNNRNDSTAPPTAGETASPPKPELPSPVAPLAAETSAVDPAPEVGRTEVNATKPADAYAQGVRGRVLDPDGNPVGPTKVYLLEAAGVDLFQQLMRANQGVRVPPLARGETDSNGRFLLGIEMVEAAKRYEVRVISDRFVDYQVPPLTLKENEWCDVGDLKLARGTLLWGRVTIEGSSGMPVPQARVLVSATNFFPGISAAPGREEGIEVRTDSTGMFRLENAPAGIVNIAAVAPRFARIEKQNISLEATGENQVMFELPAGLSIGGMVTDAQGKAIPGAKIEATSISSKSPARGTTRSNDDGSFEVIGLIDGQYLVSAIAPGYVRVEHKPIEAGDTQLQIILETQCSAGLRVFDHNGRLLNRYLVTLKTFFEGQEHFGNTELPPRQARPDANGVTKIDGLNPGSYVFQVEAEAHCKAFSEPFQVALGGDTPTVDVRLTEGGILEGTVLDLHGQPLPGVRVSTLPNHLDENPFTAMFQGMIPYKITKASLMTDSNGRYRFTLLNPGEYQLKFAHPEFFEVFLKGNIVAEAQTTTVPPLSLERGTQVAGDVRVDGVPAAQVKVTISSASDPQNPTPALFSCEAITDGSGQFVMPKRVPPGRYQLMAARQTLANPLLQIADFHRSRQEITLGSGQDTYSVQIALPANPN